MISRRDLESYKVLWEEPLETTYGDARVYAPGPSSPRRGRYTRGAEPAGACRAEDLRACPPNRRRASSGSCRSPAIREFRHSHPEPLTRRFPDRDLSPRARVSKQSLAVGLGPDAGRRMAVRHQTRHDVKEPDRTFIGSRGRRSLGQRRRGDAYDLHRDLGQDGNLRGRDLDTRCGRLPARGHEAGGTRQSTDASR